MGVLQGTDDPSESRDSLYRRVHKHKHPCPCVIVDADNVNDAPMKVTIKHWNAVAQWRWNTGGTADQDDEGDVCGICRVPYEGCCPSCKMPGDDCPLIWGECSHIFHMHCLLKWLGTAASKQQCPMDRRPWVTAERKVAPIGTQPVQNGDDEDETEG